MISVLYAVIAVFCMLGILEFSHFIAMKIYEPKHKTGQIIVYPLRGTTEELELQIKYIYHRAAWNGDNTERILFLDLGLNDEGKRIAKILANELLSASYCDRSSVAEEIFATQKR